MAHWRGVLIGGGLIILLGLLCLITYLATKSAVTAPSAVANPTWTCQDSYAVASGGATGNYTIHLCRFGPLRALRITAFDIINDQCEFIFFDPDTIPAADLPALDPDSDFDRQVMYGDMDLAGFIDFQVGVMLFDDGSIMIGTAQYGFLGFPGVTITQFDCTLEDAPVNGVDTTLTWLATFNQGPPVTVAPIVVGLGPNGTKMSTAKRFAAEWKTRAPKWAMRPTPSP